MHRTCLDQDRTNFQLVVSDNGVGKTSAGEGSGARMLNAMVRTFGGSIE